MLIPPWKLRPQKRKTKNVDPKTKVLAGNPAVVLIFLMVIEHALKHQFYMYSFNRLCCILNYQAFDLE